MKKLLLFLSLMFIVIPLAGCNEGDDSDSGNSKVSVSVNLVKGSENDVSFNIDDCARIINGNGIYEVGDFAPISVEYYSSACTFHFVLDNKVEISNLNTEESSNGKRLLSFNLHVDKQVSRNLEVVFTGIDGTADRNQIIFDGLGYISGTSAEETIPYGSFSFPYRNVANQYEENIVKVQSIENGKYPKAGEVTTETSMDSIFNQDNKKLNLNYVYLKQQDGSFKLSPYKVSWKIGKLNNSGACTYEYSSTIANIDDYRIQENDRDLCLRATVNTNTVLSETKNKAIENMLSSEVYISTSSNHDCNNAYVAGVSVDESCMYAMRIKSLYNVENTDNYSLDKGAYYYGLDLQGNLEGVVTTTNGVTITSRRYILCSTPFSELGICNDQNTLWSNYEYLHNATTDNSYKNGSYKKLSIKNFIDALKTTNENSTTTTYGVTETIVYEYNHFIDDIVPIQIGNYYIRYLSSGDGNPTYNGSAKFSNSITGVESKEYTLNIEKIVGDSSKDEAIEKLSELVNSNRINLIASSDENAKNALRTNIFKLIYTDNRTELASLKGYKFVVSVVDGDTLNVTLEKALITIEDQYDYDFIKIDNQYCGINDSECATNEDNVGLYAKELYHIVKKLTSESDILTLSFTDITNEGTATIFKFNDGTVVKIDGNKIENTSNNVSIEYITATKVDNINIKTISSEVSAFGKKLTQSLTIFSNGKGDTITKFGDQIIEGSDNVGEVGKVYELFYKADGTLNGHFYDVDSNGKIDVFLTSDNKTIKITYNDIKQKYYYIGTINEVTYDFLLDFASYKIITPKIVKKISEDESNIRFVKLGTKTCTYAQRTDCDNSYLNFLKYTDKLISLVEIGTIEFTNITQEGNVVTYVIGGATPMTITYDTQTHKFKSDDKTIMYYIGDEMETSTVPALERILLNKTIIQGDPEQEVDVTQELSVISAENKYEIVRKDEHNDIVMSENDIENILKIFYNINEEDNTIDSLNEAAKWYLIEDGFILISDGANIYEFSSESATIAKITDLSNNLEFQVEIKVAETA